MGVPESIIINMLLKQLKKHIIFLYLPIQRRYIFENVIVQRKILSFWCFTAIPWKILPSPGNKSAGTHKAKKFLIK